MLTQEQRRDNMAKARQARLDNIAAAKSVKPAAPSEIPAENEAGVSFETRQPFGSFVQKLAAPPIAGMHLHWFNDEPGRVDTAKQAGYTHVLDAAGKNRSRVVDKTTGMLGYLMKTPQEWYEHDMAQQQVGIDGMEDAIRRGADENGQPGKDGRYIPKQGISIRTNRR
jgi:hypothetical protein